MKTTLMIYIAMGVLTVVPLLLYNIRKIWVKKPPEPVKFNPVRCVVIVAIAAFIVTFLVNSYHATLRNRYEIATERVAQLHAEVLTFSRLASRVFAERGGVAETETDGGGKLLMMALAVEQVRSRLKIFGASAARAEFLLQLLDMLEEFRSFCVTADQLRRAAAGLTGTLAVKTEEFALLMESYDAVCAQIGQNPQSRLTRLLNALEDCDDLSDREFWIDGFTDFNGVERNILAQLLNGGAGLTVALLCDGLHGHAQQYAAARETAAALCAIVAQQQIPVETRQLPPREETSALARLRAELFGGAMHPWDAPQDAVAFLWSLTWGIRHTRTRF